jgi:hypothetical protein
MEQQLMQLRALSFFANQMLIAVVKNAIINGAYDPNAARTNVQETLDQATRSLHAGHNETLTRIATAYNVAIDAGEVERTRPLEG